MGNIVGEGTPEYVKKQVDIRQEIHGSLNRTNDELVYLNSKTAFVKLVSSVFVSDDINDLGLAGNQLAEQYVLFNGTTNESPRSGALETYQRSGIARDKSIINDNAYGLGGLEMGIKPMMGITSATIKSENRGSLRTSTVSIIANNKKQFEIIETLYLKLGYFMLLEWGWTNYFNNKKDHIKDNPHSLADDFLLRNKNYDTLLKLIENKRNKSDGNYDALIGKVVNFNWTFTQDGVYNITIILRSMGDVIESLKTNILLPKDAIPSKSSTTPPTTTTTEENQEEPNPEQTLSEFIVSYKDKHSIGKFFYNNTIALDKQKVNPDYGSIFLKNKGVSFIKQQYKDGQNSGKNGITQYYIRFERFLRYIEENLIPTIDNNGKTKFINFDTDIESNIIYLESKTISTDIRVCIFKVNTSIGPDTYYMLPDGEEYIKKIGSNSYGKIMNIYFNMGWILTTMDNLVDSEGNVSLYELLKSICNGYNESTGGFNKLHPTVDPDTNKIVFRDETPLPDKDDLINNKETAFFNTFGYNGFKGPSNFVRNLSFNTTISPNLSTMITVGATKDGYTPGYDATGLRAINYGTYDAIKPKLINNSGEETATTSSNKKLKSTEEKYGSALLNFNKYFYQISSLNKETIPSFNVDDMNSYKSTLKNIIEYSQLKNTKDEQIQDPLTGKYKGSPNIGFIPFDLQLTIDGLSGIKIYNKIQLDTFFLPLSYPQSLEFIIKGVDHTIAENDWTTNLSTLAIPRKPYGSQTSITNPSSVEKVASRGNVSVASSSPVTYFQSNLPPNQAKNRVTLTRILDDGTQTLGILEIYNVDRTKIIYTLATVELPWKNNENGKSAIPTGNYLVNSRQTSKYGKHFFIIGSESGQWKRIPGSNPSDRTGILIHTAPKAPGWLQGCIGPGPQFDFKHKNSKGNPDGVGTNYLNPAKSESTAALNKLVDTFYNDKGFKMEIKNLDNVASNALPKSINDAKIKKLATNAIYRDLFKGM